MPYEYRQFVKTNQYKFKKYDEVDLYLFKPKLNGIGVKARYQVQSQSLPKSWSVIEFQVKIIKNYSEIAAKKTLMQDWKKYIFDCEFTIYSRAYFQQNYKNSSETEIDKRIQQHLKDIGHKIVTIIRHSEQIKTKYFTQNLDLKRWLQQEDDLFDIYAIRKQRNKSFSCEEGHVKVISLFDKNYIPDDYVFKTKAFEQKKQQDLHKLLKKFQINIAENISYPSLLQKKYAGVI